MKANKVSKETYHAVMERDKCCQLCGSTTWLIEHHILYKSLMGNSEKENLIVLCTHCHINKVHKNSKYFFILLMELQQKHYPSLTKRDLKLANKWVRAYNKVSR